MDKDLKFNVDELIKTVNALDIVNIDEFLREVLDFQYIVRLGQPIDKYEYTGGILLLTYGGPTIRLYTQTYEIKGGWGSDTYSNNYNIEQGDFLTNYLGDMFYESIQ